MFFEEIQNVISLSFKVSDTETDVVVLGDNLRVQPNTPNEDYIFQKWSLLTTANKPYHTMNTSSAFTFTINSKLIKTCYILPDIDYPNGRLVF